MLIFIQLQNTMSTYIHIYIYIVCVIVITMQVSNILYRFNIYYKYEYFFVTVTTQKYFFRHIYVRNMMKWHITLSSVCRRKSDNLYKSYCYFVNQTKI